MTTYQTSYEPTLNDALACSRLYFCRTTYSKKSLSIWAAIIVVVVVYVLYSNGSNASLLTALIAMLMFASCALLGLLAFLVMGYAVLPLQTRLIWSRNKHLQYPVDVEWDQNSVTYNNIKGRMTHEWSDYSKILDDQHVLIFVQSKCCMHYIPTRALTEEQRQDILSKQTT